MTTPPENTETIAALRERVAELEQQNQLLREQQKIMQKVIDNSSSIIYAKDTQGRYLLVNKQASLVLGKQPADILGKTDADLLPPEIADAFSDGDRTVLATGKRLEREEIMVIEDTVSTFLAQGFPIFDDHGTPYAVGGIATNITRLKQTEIQLRMSEAKNRALLEAIPDLIFHLTEDGTFVNYKASKSQELAVPPEVFLGKRVSDVLPEALAVNTMQRIKWALETGQMQYYEYSMDIQGVTGFFEARYSPSGDSEVIAIIRDVTNLKQAESERMMYQQQVIDAQKSAIRELSTPLIPLSPSVVLMPLLGKMDTQRVQLVMETLLEGIAEYQADMAILDITGVTMVDVQVANGLIQVARAARLLGARVVITGIGAAMAQTLVHLEADLSSVVTRGSLQHAIAEVFGVEKYDNTLSWIGY